MIRIDRPFSLYATCSIEYEGRAKSTLTPGNYLIIHKGDGTLLIHGASKFNVLNYQPPGAILRREHDHLISTRKNETIKIHLQQIIHYYEFPDWSNKIDITMTEKHLRLQIIENIGMILNDAIIETIPEFATPYGPVDLVAISSTGLYYIIEIKRNKAALAGATQLGRYLSYFREIEQETQGWLMSPAISSGALEYCRKHGFHWGSVRHA